MPVILDPADYPAWPGEAPTNENELRALRPFPAEKMRAFRIGQRIGYVKNEMRR